MHVLNPLCSANKSKQSNKELQRNWVLGQEILLNPTDPPTTLGGSKKEGLRYTVCVWVS